MARLPDFNVLGERPIPLPARRTPSVAQFRGTTGLEEVPAQELNRSSNELEQAAHVVFQAKQEHDTLVAEDAFTKLRQKQFDLTYGEGGIATVKGANAMNRDLPAEYGAKLQTYAQQLSDGLGNDYQRQLFSKRASVAQLQLQEHAYAHVARESDVYADQVFKGIRKTEIGLASADPSQTGLALQRIDKSTADYANRFGMPDEWVRAEGASARSELYASQVKTLMSTNPVLAREYFHKKDVFENISPQERPVLEHMLKQATLPIEVKTEAEQIMKTTKPEPVVADLQALKKAIRTAEGSGPESVSPQGARGSMQITKATFDQYAKPGESFDNEADRVAAAERKIESDYEFYGGDVRKAAAAYIGGRGAIDESGQIRNVKDALGTTAEAYANKVAQIVGAVPQMSRDTRAMLGSWIAEAERRYPDDPVRRDALIKQIQGNVSTIVHTQEGIQRNAQGVLMQIANGGPDGKSPKPTTPDQLLQTPEARNAYQLLDPAAQGGIRAILTHNANEAERGTPIPNDPKVMEDLYNRMFLPWGDARKIYSERQLTPYFAHGMNMQGRNFLMGVLNQQQTEDGQRLGALRNNTINSFKPQIVKAKLGELPDPKSEEMFNNFRQDVIAKEAKMRGEGKDPATLYDRNSPDYIGKMVPSYQISMQERLQHLMPQNLATGTIRTPQSAPQVGTIKDGYRFKGGNPADKNNWEKQ